jgi:hypothetical protein
MRGFARLHTRIFNRAWQRMLNQTGQFATVL